MSVVDASTTADFVKKGVAEPTAAALQPVPIEVRSQRGFDGCESRLALPSFLPPARHPHLTPFPGIGRHVQHLIPFYLRQDVKVHSHPSRSWSSADVYIGLRRCNRAVCAFAWAILCHDTIRQRFWSLVVTVAPTVPLVMASYVIVRRGAW